jgi:hypothetical protein
MVGFSKYVIFKNIQILKIRKNKHKKENLKQGRKWQLGRSKRCGRPRGTARVIVSRNSKSD